MCFGLDTTMQHLYACLPTIYLQLIMHTTGVQCAPLIQHPNITSA